MTENITRIDGPGVSGKIEPKWLLDGVIHGTSLIVISDTPPTPKDNVGHASNSKSERSEGFGVVPEEPRDWQLREMYDLAGGTHFDKLRDVYNAGAASVAARLPRLWGWWNGRSWGTSFSTVQGDVACHCAGHHGIREFDPMTGKPKEPSNAQAKAAARG